jgi:PhoH-like ATPase
MPKTYVLDTNVLLHNPSALFAFEENSVVIPLAVIEEIDNQKKRQDEIGRNARLVSQELDKMRAKGRLSSGVRLPSKGKLRIEVNHQDMIDFPAGLDDAKHDNRILAVVLNLKKQEKGPVILVTKDLNLRIKAYVVGICAEDFHNDKVDYHHLCTGVGEIHVGTDEMDAFFRDGRLAANGRFQGLPQQFFLIRTHDNPSRSALARCFQNTLWPLVHGDSVNWGIRANNKEQRFAKELLLNDQIKIVSLVGCAGTGKTLLALAVGLEKVMEQNAYGRLLVTRPVTPMGDDLGYLPGSKEDKLRPWMQPIYYDVRAMAADAYVVKSFDLSELKLNVQRALDGRAPESLNLLPRVGDTRNGDWQETSNAAI